MPTVYLVPQIVTAIATLGGVVLTLVATTWRENRNLARQDIWKQHDRRDAQLRWVRAERRSVYAKFVGGLEEITRALKQAQSADSEPPSPVDRIRGSAGDAWDALIELRLIAPPDVVETAEGAMFFFRLRCREFEESAAVDLPQLQALTDELLSYRNDVLRHMRLDLAVEVQQ